jgi:hypothetical protein
MFALVGARKMALALLASTVTVSCTLPPTSSAQGPLASTRPYSATLGVPAGLPAGLPPLYGVDCPTALHCTVVGGSGTTAVALSSLGGSHWVKTTLASVGPLYSVSCTNDVHCAAVGGGQSGHESAVTVNGTRWQPLATPAGTVPLDSVSCVAAGCVAVGERYDSAARSYRSNLVVLRGAAWATSPLPSPSAVLSSASCAGAGHCWVAGGGSVYFSSDLFSAKRPIWSPEQIPESQGLAWLIDSVHFTSASDGVASGGTQCGGFFVLQCAGVIFRTTDGGAQWRTGQLPGGAPFVVSASCSATGCLALAQSFTNSVVLSSSNGTSWAQTEATAGFLNSSTCNPRSCIAVGENNMGTGGIVLSSPGGSTAAPAMPHLPGGSFAVDLSFTGPVRAHFASASVPQVANASPASGFCGTVPKSTFAGFFDLLSLPGARAIGVLQIVLQDYHGPGKYVVPASAGGASPAIQLSSFPGTYKLVAPATVMVAKDGVSGTITAAYAKEVFHPGALGAAAVGASGLVGFFSGSWAC